MSDDRADEIARGITGQIMLWGPIAAALRSYGREMADAKLEEAAVRVIEIRGGGGDRSALAAAAKIIRSLKSKPEAQDTQT